MPEAAPDLFEIIATTRSMRRLKPDPVPAELIRKILEAGTAAPSGGNMQRWRFLVVTDAKIKETVGAYYKRASDENVYPRYSAGAPAPGTSLERFRRMLDAAQHLADHIHESPVWIVPCIEGANPSRTAGSSIYPAVQNMLLAARALGLGATLTTLYLAFEKEGFVDAVTDDLTTDLSRIANSFVIARTTAFTYKGEAADVRQIGRDLGVRYVLEGSVRRLGEQVQVNVQLIDAESGAHVWANRFDTDRRNRVKAQEQITARLAHTLHLELLEAVGRQIERDKSTNLDAEDLVMHGWAWQFRPTSETQAREALQAFEQALAMDPASVGARVGIARVLLDYVATGWSKSREQDMARADQLLAEAVERDRNYPRLNWAIGWLRRLQGRFIESKIEHEKALALDRNDAGAMMQLGWTLMALNKHVKRSRLSSKRSD